MAKHPRLIEVLTKSGRPLEFIIFCDQRLLRGHAVKHLVLDASQRDGHWRRLLAFTPGDIKSLQKIEVELKAGNCTVEKTTVSSCHGCNRFDRGCAKDIGVAEKQMVRGVEQYLKNIIAVPRYAKYHVPARTETSFEGLDDLGVVVYSSELPGKRGVFNVQTAFLKKPASQTFRKFVKWRRVELERIHDRAYPLDWYIFPNWS